MVFRVSIDEKVEQVFESHRKRLDEWMVENGFKNFVGGETFEELLSELTWKVKKVREDDFCSEHGD